MDDNKSRHVCKTNTLIMYKSTKKIKLILFWDWRSTSICTSRYISLSEFRKWSTNIFFYFFWLRLTRSWSCFYVWCFPSKSTTLTNLEKKKTESRLLSMLLFPLFGYRVSWIWYFISFTVRSQRGRALRTQRQATNRN